MEDPIFSLLSLTIKGVVGSSKTADVTMRIGSKKNAAIIEMQADYDRYETVTVISKDPDEPDRKEEVEHLKESGKLKFMLNILNIRFRKRMYQPNEVVAEIQIETGSKEVGNVDTYENVSIDASLLETAFAGKQALLMCNGMTVGNDFYVHDVIPSYKTDAIYLTLKMYSPDMVMTLAPYSQSFVAKRLTTEILEGDKGQLANFTLPYGTAALELKAHMRHLQKDGREHIFPYLVQYNESFYDFLARTTNRWGEFLYYENGKLNIGYEKPADKDVKDIKFYNTVTFGDMTSKQPQQKQAGDYNPEATYDSHVLTNVFNKDSYDCRKGELGCGWNSGLDTYLMRKFGQLLTNDANIVDFLVNTLVDDGLTVAKSKERVSTLNGKFNKKYFKENKSLPQHAEQYDGDGYNEFSEYKPIVDEVKYANILKGEIAAGKNQITIDFDTTYPGLSLGEVIKVKGKQYIVVQIDGYQPEKLFIVNNEYIKVGVDQSRMAYKVVAIAQNSDGNFYPTVLPTGHVRKSGPQVGVVVDDDDPHRNNRVRIRLSWQKADDDATPWLIYTAPGSTAGTGLHARHLKDEKVLVNFLYDNVERPYITGATEEKVPGALKTNNFVAMTPGGQSFKLSDGPGAGVTALMSSVFPGFGMITGFMPGQDLLGGSMNESAIKSISLEGGFEMGDKYGLWSIKGSTDQRNISVSSPWGDVKINAFTGITISAPNGDVTIKGKNVKIEAGNNLTLTSGKNISDKFYPNMFGTNQLTASILLSIPEAVTKKIAQMVGKFIDISVVRHVFELIGKPVEGKLSINSNRYLMLGAGGYAAAYPMGTSKYQKKPDSGAFQKQQQALRQFEALPDLCNSMFSTFKSIYSTAQEKKQAIGTTITEHTKVDDQNQQNNVLPCKSLDNIISEIWNNPNVETNAAFMTYQGFLAEPVEGQQDCHDIIRHYYPAHNPDHELDMAYLQDTINMVKDRQNGIKHDLETLVAELKTNIAALKSYMTDTYAAQLNNIADAGLRQALGGNNLGNDHAIQELLNNAEFKDLTLNADTSLSDAKKKMVKRKMFQLAVDYYKIKEIAPISKSGASTPVNKPDPYNTTDEEWNKWVDCLIYMEADKKEKDLKTQFWEKAIKDPALKAISSELDLVNNMRDLWAYGDNKKGQILFSSESNTMVLGTDIYRANTDFSERQTYGRNGEHDFEGYVAQIRGILKQ